MSQATNHDGAPNYEVEIDAAELREDLAELSAKHAKRAEEYRRWDREHFEYALPDQLPPPGDLTEFGYDALEQSGRVRAFGDAIAKLQPAGRTRYLNDDGTVRVREFMRWLKRRGDAAHEDRYGPWKETRGASGAESAYAKALSVIRNEYGVGWPRLDEVSATAIPEDEP